MSSKEEDKNKQTSTPTQRRTRKEDRELSKRRAEAKSPDVGKLHPLVRSTGSVTWVSPELSNAEKSKDGNKLDPKRKEEEEEEEEEGDKKAGDEEEKEDPKDDDDSSNGPNSNMATVLVPFDLDLTHVLTIVCGF